MVNYRNLTQGEAQVMHDAEAARQREVAELNDQIFELECELEEAHQNTARLEWWLKQEEWKIWPTKRGNRFMLLRWNIQGSAWCDVREFDTKIEAIDDAMKEDNGE